MILLVYLTQQFKVVLLIIDIQLNIVVIFAQLAGIVVPVKNRFI